MPAPQFTERAARTFVVNPVVLTWLIAAAVLIYGLEWGWLSADRHLTLTALAGLLHAGVVFWRHGGPSITAPGMFMIGTGIFVYFPALYLTQALFFAPTPSQNLILTVTFLSQVLMYHLWWAPRSPDWQATEPGATTPAVTFWTFQVGVVLVALGLVLERTLALGVSTPAGAAAFLGVSMVGISVITARAQLSPSRLVVAIAAFAAYVLLMFGGGGRLILGVLAFVLAIAVAQQRRRRSAKAAVLIALPAAMIVLAVDRATRVAISSGRTETGLESVIWPFERAADLVDLALSGRLEYGMGSSFWATLTAFVPRSLWPEKPIGLGLELTYIFRPELVPVGHSEAALLQGEWVFNFGMMGLVFGLPVTAWFVGWLDRQLHKFQLRPTTTKRRMLGKVATILATAGLLDLVWVGTFTYMTRTGMRLGVLLVILVLFAWRASTPPMSRLNARDPLALARTRSERQVHRS